MPAADTDTAPRSPRRWRRRIAIGLLVVVIVFVAVIGAGILFRKDVLQAVIEDQLAAMGLHDASFSVARVTEDEISIVDLRADETVQIDRLTLRYTAGELLEGRLRRVEIAGLRIDLTRPGKGAIGILSTGGGDEGQATQSAKLPPIPAVHVTDAKIRAAVTGRPVVLHVDGTIGPLDKRDLPVRLKLGLETAEGRADGPLKLDVAFDEKKAGDMTASGDLRLESKALAIGGVTLRRVKAYVPIAVALKSSALTGELAKPATLVFDQAARGDDLRIGPATAMLSGHFLAKLAGSTIAASGGFGDVTLRIDKGRSRTVDFQALDVGGTVEFDTTQDVVDVRAPSGLDISLQGARIGDALMGRTTMNIAASMNIHHAQAAMSGEVFATGKTNTATLGTTSVKNLAFEIPLDYLIDARNATVGLSRPASLTIGVAVAGNDARVERGRVDLTGTGVLKREKGRAGQWAGKLSGAAATIVLDGSRFQKASVSAPVRLDFDDGTAQLRLTAPGNVSVGSVRSGTLRSARAVSLKLNPRKAPLLRASPLPGGDQRLDFDVGARLARLVLRETGKKKGTQAITADLGPIAVTGRLDPATGLAGRLRLTRARLAAQGQQVAMAGVDVRVSAGPKGAAPTARLRIGTLRRIAPPSPVPPVAVDATFRPRGDVVRFSATVKSRDAPVRVVASGTHNMKRQSGRADVTVRGLDFFPGGLQPQQLVPGLSTLKDVGGSVAASAMLRWSRAKVDGTARVSLQDLGAKTDAGAIDGLNGTVVFESLNPPSTPAGQRLTIRAIDVGPKLADASLVFALRRDGELAIERADMGIAGGRLRLVDQKIDPFAKTIRTTIEVADVELEELIGLFDLGDVSATGRLTGAIPLAVSGQTVSVSRGRLAAKSGGTLRVRSQQASQVLAAGGEQVRLMLQALEDFRYRTLSIDIDKSADGKALVSLRTLGHNPTVLDGQPFQINVNLETNLDRVLAAVAQWYRLSGRALRDIVGGGTLGGTKAK